jgi:hypothetical protein
MSELITDLDYRIVDEAGEEYYVSAAGELGPDGGVGGLAGIRPDGRFGRARHPF